MTLQDDEKLAVALSNVIAVLYDHIDEDPRLTAATLILTDVMRKDNVDQLTIPDFLARVDASGTAFENTLHGTHASDPLPLFEEDD